MSKRVSSGNAIGATHGVGGAVGGKQLREDTYRGRFESLPRRQIGKSFMRKRLRSFPVLLPETRRRIGSVRDFLSRMAEKSIQIFDHLLFVYLQIRATPSCDGRETTRSFGRFEGCISVYLDKRGIAFSNRQNLPGPDSIVVIRWQRPEVRRDGGSQAGDSRESENRLRLRHLRSFRPTPNGVARAVPDPSAGSGREAASDPCPWARHAV